MMDDTISDDTCSDGIKAGNSLACMCRKSRSAEFIFFVLLFGLHTIVGIMAAPSTPVRFIAPVPSTPTTTRSPLSKRAFTLTLLPPTIAQPIHSRHLKRIHVAAEIMKAAKVCAGDVLVLRGMEELDKSMEGMSLEVRFISDKIWI